MAGCLCCDGTESLLSVSHTQSPRPGEMLRRQIRSHEGMLETLHSSAAGERCVWFHMSGVCVCLSVSFKKQVRWVKTMQFPILQLFKLFLCRIQYIFWQIPLPYLHKHFGSGVSRTRLHVEGWRLNHQPCGFLFSFCLHSMKITNVFSAMSSS